MGLGLGLGLELGLGFRVRVSGRCRPEHLRRGAVEVCPLLQPLQCAAGPHAVETLREAVEYLLGQG